ncbi:MAG: hypothetical protein LBJ09_03725 [Clostridiales bacterium]|jgi:hypothetical protein|nr:hypothetical protein [Clostridiales bacterium]
MKSVSKDDSERVPESITDYCESDDKLESFLNLKLPRDLKGDFKLASNAPREFIPSSMKPSQK